MEKTARPILYSFRRCPYAMRARLGILFSGTRVELREVILRDKPQALRDASAKATVPVLVLADGTVIDESFDIMHWVLSKHDPQQILAPEIGALSDMLALIDDNDGPFKHHLDRTKYPDKFEGSETIDHRAEAMTFIARLDLQLADRVFLFGSRLSLADLAISPFVRQFAHVNRPLFEASAPPHVLRWLNAFKESDYFAAIMGKYDQWQMGEPGVDFNPAATLSRT